MSQLAVTTDMLLENVHFHQGSVSPHFLGQKSLRVSLSDLAAVGASPYACLLSLGLPAELTQEYFHAFMKGFLEDGANWKVPLVGGDLSRSETVVVNVTVWGYFETGVPLWRSQAQDRDALVLIGDVGLSRLGLEILRGEDCTSLATMTHEDELVDWAHDTFRAHCLKAHLLPRPLVETGIWLSANSAVNAMIDVSDGLCSDLLHIALESGLMAEIRVDHLPLPEKGWGKITALEAALDGGENYALLATASEEQLAQLGSTYPSDFPPYQVIGHLSSGNPAVYLSRSGKREKYEPRGFDHFR
jgi:thiamine-monophosphate kinase